ncbi:MAG: hypothetical protein HC878_18195 [Leptolyngbyaceae cyanobacterium SL_5_14]|nr:hypothetical protein [Leptolyngbyaceae cyanobacterium SL_5_14]
MQLADGILSFSHCLQTEQFLLVQVAQRVEQILDPIVQASLTAASAILAGLRVDKEVIYKLLRRDIMKESIIYREIQQEAEARGEAKNSGKLLLTSYEKVYPLKLLLVEQAYRSSRYSNFNSK